MVYILPVAAAGALAPCQYVGERVEGIDFGTVEVIACGFTLGEGAASNAVDCPLVGIISAESHAIGVEGQENLWLPMYGDRGVGFEYFADGSVGHVAFAGGGKASVEGDVVMTRMGIACGIEMGRLLRSHRVAR